MKDYGIIDSEGQVTLPQSVCDHLGLKAGDRVEFVIEDERIVLRAARSEENSFEKYRGILGTFPGGDAEINARIADMRDDDEA
jgi:AbrB family looped-hinge helix DNA binding protein